ncbi:MAG TPA: NACHT domain-containing protein [Bryobacteraceae bacterium]|nr:NACHT domain-containing protein [Bryobacteraceae bacterium]
MSHISDSFFGNRPVCEALEQMIATGRIPQTILLAGPAGIGKATLARRFAARLLGDETKIEEDDLSLPQHVELIEQREKWPADKRADDPLLFASHPDFLTFTPEGPLRQISIQQIRLLKERAQFRPLRGERRVFLVDRLDRANEQAANSLLKLLEEPPEYLIVIATAENVYDLLPTIRSRSVVFSLTRLSDSEMREFIKARSLKDGELRWRLSEGCPGFAATLDLAKYQERRNLMLKMFECASGLVPFSAWVRAAESFSNRKTEKLDFYLKPAYRVLEDILAAANGIKSLRNADVEEAVRAIAARVPFEWLEHAARAVDELSLMARRNIQKIIALDAVIMDLRNQLRVECA